MDRQIGCPIRGTDHLMASTMEAALVSLRAALCHEVTCVALESADTAVFLAYDYKIGNVSSAFEADVAFADLLVTDSGADAGTPGELRQRGIEIEAVGLFE